MQQSNCHMFSDISDLGGTHVQQSFRSRRNICAAVFCVPFPPNIYVPHFAVYSKAIQYVSYMSYQNHVGLQPANLVTSTTVSCSRRSVLSVRLFFTSFLRFIQYFVFFRPFTTELQYGLLTSVTYRTRYFRTFNSTWRTVRTCSCPISMPDLQYALDVSCVPYEIFQSNSQSKKAHQ